MAEDSGWCTIESDPGVFTDLLSSIGVQDVQVEELYSLDRSLISSFGRVHGLVFLFKYDKALSATVHGTLVPPPTSLFFANQTIHNACATQAILSIVLNAPHLEVGAELARFRAFADGMDPVTTGMVVGNSEVIRAAHNSFAPQQQFVVEDAGGGEKEDPFHFVAYVPHAGKAYELDGLREGPVEVGVVADGEDWLDVVTPVIAARMEEYQGAGEGGEIRFNLMGVVEDPRRRLRAEIAAAEKEGGEEKEAGVVRLREELRRQEEKHKAWAAENARRRWNFVPFIVSFLKALAEGGEAERVIQEVTEKKKAAYRETVAKQGAASGQ